MNEKTLDRAKNAADRLATDTGRRYAVLLDLFAEWPYAVVYYPPRAETNYIALYVTGEEPTE